MRKLNRAFVVFVVPRFNFLLYTRVRDKSPQSFDFVITEAKISKIKEKVLVTPFQGGFRFRRITSYLIIFNM